MDQGERMCFQYLSYIYIYIDLSQGFIRKKPATTMLKKPKATQKPGAKSAHLWREEENTNGWSLLTFERSKTATIEIPVEFIIATSRPGLAVFIRWHKRSTMDTNHDAI